MAAPKFYVVLKGRKPGIFNSWQACKESIEGFPGAVYRSFTNQQEAEQAMAKGKFDGPPKSATSPAKTPVQARLVPAGAFARESISVDAACSGNPGLMEYRGVDNLCGSQIFHVGPLPNGTNNIGEFLAIVHALAYLKKLGSTLPIYSDSRNAIGWVKQKTIRTTLQRSAHTEKVWELIDRAIAWLKNNNYPNKILKWETTVWGENPADFGRK